MKPLKKRDIPDESRPVAFMNFTNTLGKTKMGQRVMIGLGEQYKQGKDYFFITKYIQFYQRLLIAISLTNDGGIKRTVAKDYRLKLADTIKKIELPFFIERNALSLLAAKQRDFTNLLNKEQKVKECDATESDSSKTVWDKK